MRGVCLTCGLRANEAHHIAGRRNHPSTVDVCLDCHRILSIWQRAAGIELHDAVEGTQLDATRALLIGAMHLLQLFAQRHRGEAWFPNWLAIHTTRAISKLLDQQQPADREGRWLPNPTVVPIEAAPIDRRTVSEAEQIAEIAHLGGALSKIIGEFPQLPTATFTHIAEHPDLWRDSFDRAMQVASAAAALPIISPGIAADASWAEMLTASLGAVKSSMVIHGPVARLVDLRGERASIRTPQGRPERLLRSVRRSDRRACRLCRADLVSDQLSDLSGTPSEGRG